MHDGMDNLRMTYYCDSVRWHLICIPYSIANLHAMADDLGIHRCHFHRKNPRMRIAEISARCVILPRERDIVNLIRESHAPLFR